MAEVDVIREVTEVVEGAIRRNRAIETLLITILVALALTGIGLLIYGTVVGRWELATPGAICELAIGWPIRSLMSLRQENVRLQILPQMLRLADSSDKKRLAFDLVSTLIGQIR
jgi:hypothetical protein